MFVFVFPYNPRCLGGGTMNYKPASRFSAAYHELVTFLKSNMKVESALRVLARPVFRYWMWKEARAEKMRREGYVDPKFTWIKDVKGTHEGERCFVVGCGPSLLFSDLDMIKDEFSFGVNALIKSFDKTVWRPSVYGVTDKYGYEAFRESIESHSELNVWVAEDIDKVFSLPDWIKVFPTNLFDYRMYFNNSRRICKIAFSDDPYAAVYPAYSVVFAMMQFAVYMGFKEIYLLGCDCNYKQEKQHFITFEHRNNVVTSVGEKMILVHTEFRKFADAHGVKVVNCTRGGMLEAYPRMTLEEVLGRKE